MLVLLLYIVSTVCYGSFILFHFYYEVINKKPELVLKYQVSKTHKDSLRSIGFVWAVIFFISLLTPAIAGVEGALYCALGLASIPWLVNVAKIKLSERKKSTNK